MAVRWNSNAVGIYSTLEGVSILRMMMIMTMILMITTTVMMVRVIVVVIAYFGRGVIYLNTEFIYSFSFHFLGCMFKITCRHIVFKTAGCHTIL